MKEDFMHSFQLDRFLILQRDAGIQNLHYSSTELCANCLIENKPTYAFDGLGKFISKSK